MSDHRDLVKPPIWTRALGALFILLALLVVCTLPTHGQANVAGQWQTLPTLMPINPVHVALMHNGKVLIVSGSGNFPSDANYLAAVWDPQTNTVTTQSVPFDMFCNGMIVLPDGRPFIMGGTLMYSPPQFEGLSQTAAYDPATGNFVELQSMAHGRWYPTATTLSDGSVMVFSGLDESDSTNTTVEIYKVGSGWSQPFGAGWTPPLYPRMHLLPNGTVFYSGPSASSAIFNSTTHTWTTGVATTNYGGTRTYGSSVLLPLMPANNYDPRVMIMGGDNPANATTEIIDLGASHPQWVFGPSMSEPRIEMDAVILPNGKVLALNGSTSDEDANTASLNADLYDPNTNTFSSAGVATYPRLYHSGALLLPNATVLVLGGNPVRGTYEPHLEIYTPAYLFNSDGSPATQPTITSVTPGVIGYGGSFQIQTPNAANISSIVLVRAGSPTHAFDMDQRLVGLNFTTGNGVLNATAPPNGSIAPPGYYLLFILNSAGVPSVAQFVKLSLAPTDQPPTGIITSPSSNVTINPGQSVSFQGTGTSANSTIAAYSWMFPGGNPTSSSLANPGAVTYPTSAPVITSENPTAGPVGTLVTITAAPTNTYVASLTVTDSLGVTDPSPPTRTITMSGGFGSSQGTSTVTFNGVTATPTSWTASSITVPVPSGATSGSIVVTAGGVASNGVGFTVTTSTPPPAITSLSPTSGPVGTAVTITGTYFGSSGTVTFNGTTATTTNWNSTTIVTSVPAGATSGNVVVTVSGAASNTIPFTVTSSAPPPNISLITPSSATAGGPAFPFTVNGTGFVSGAIVNFGSNPAITPSSVTSTQIVATIPATDIAAAGTVNVTVTNPAPGGTSNAQPFTINNPAPTETSISPTSATAGGAAFTLTVNGTGFVSTSVVKFNGAAKTTTFVSATQLTAAITAADIATAGTASVTVTNAAPGGGTSGTLSFTINGSALTLTSMAPASTTVGGTALTLTITGNGFVTGATVNFGANPAITPSSVTSTQIVATIPATDIAAAGTVNVTVTNPAPGGTSNAQSFTINNPAPTETSISPTSATAGGAAFTLTVNGTGFVSTSVVKFNGAAKTTTFVSATQLTAAITAADIAAAGTASVTVTNAAPGGGTSGTLSFTINGSALTLTSMAPASTTVGGTALTLTITGNGFVSGATVNFGANPAITPSSVTSTQIVATIPATDIAAAGTVNVTVTNPAPGGTSNAQTFTINNPAPTETSISPTSATAGGAAFTLTVNGTGFVSTSVVKFNGAAKTTTFVSATQLTAAITAADIAAAGTASVTVTNAAPGGGTSGTLSFTINGSALTLTSMAPASTTVGGTALTLTITGNGFVSGATVNFGANPAITPSSVTSTQIVATIPATDIAAAGTVNVTVTNPAPGGTSNAQTFTINNPAPTETSISPTSATAGGAAFTLTVNGTGFVSTSVVKFNGAAKTTTFVSATQLTAAITAADIAAAGTASVTVTNPAPGGTSSAASFTINNPAPTVSSLLPSTTVAGSAAFALTVNGAGFVNGASVQFNGSGRATTFASTTQVMAAILASDVASAGTANVTVTNPAPTVGPSAPQVFTISSPNNPVPAISNLGATHAPGGAAFSLTVNGTNFEATSVVNFNGKPETTTFVSASRLSATIPASDVAIVGNMNVTVTNPAPGGGTSTSFLFIVDGYTISGPPGASLSPSQPAMIQITATPTANGFPNPISFSVSGLPAGSTASFNPTMLTPNGNATTTTLTITDGGSAVSRRDAGMEVPATRRARSLLAIWIVALLAWLYLRLQVCTMPLTKRYAPLALAALMFLTGGVLSGCALSVNNSPSASTSQLTVTATSGTLTKTFGVTLNVAR